MDDEQLVVVQAAQMAARRTGCELVLLLAAAWALSGLRAAHRMPQRAALDARAWPKVRLGAWQQRVIESREYQETGRVLGFPGSVAMARIETRYFDPYYAARTAAVDLAASFRPDEGDPEFRALCRWDYPPGDGAPRDRATGEGFRRGLEQARVIIAGLSAEGVRR